MTNPYPQSPPQPRRRSKVWIILLAVLGGLFIICVGGAVVAAIGGNKPAAQQTTATQPTTAAPATSTTAPAPTTAAATPAGPKTSFGDGDWEVGKDITAGKYTTTVPADSTNCYWQRVKGFSGSLDEIIANGNVKPGTRAIVTIAATDKGFASKNCGTWTKS